MICLPKEFANKFLNGLKSREIDPGKLSDMTSEQRRAFFEDIVGKNNAKDVNALFESKLLLKDQQAGMITWAKEVGGLKPEVRRDMISRIEKLQEVLNPEQEKEFLNDLADKKLGVDVSFEEAKKIADLSKTVSEKKQAMSKGGDRMDYGRARVALANYMNELKEEAGKKTIGERLKNPVGAAKDFISGTAGFAKSIKASFDDSAIFRQGWKTLMTNPKVWAGNAARSFVDFYDTFGGKQVMDELNADITSRPTYDLMQKAKLAVGTIEEAYPSHIPEKIPLFSKLYKASENAYTAFVYRQRADIFDKYIDIAKKSGIELDNKQLESIGKIVNSLTGRGNLGPLEKSADAFNNVFFSPRFLKSHIDVLLVHPFDKLTPFARKQAAFNLVKVVGGTAAVMAVANAIMPGSVEKDPRSSDFGKIKVGDTRFDVSGGMASVATLAMRLIRNSEKNSSTGGITQLNSGKFGAPTSMDMIYNFITNKFSPAASLARDLLNKTDFQGNPITIKGELENTFAPLPITNYLELKNDPKSAPILAGLIADAFGIGVNTYGITKKKK